MIKIKNLSDLQAAINVLKEKSKFQEQLVQSENLLIMHTLQHPASFSDVLALVIVPKNTEQKKTYIWLD